MTTLPHILRNNFNEAPDRTSIVMLYPPLRGVQRDPQEQGAKRNPQEQGAKRNPHQVEEKISYRRLMQGAAGYARAFAEKGIRPGEVVILVLQHGADLVYSFFGAILHGAIPSILPFLTEKLSPERYQEDMTALISITRPAAVVTYPEFLPVVMGTLRAGDSVRAVLVSSDIQPAAEVDFAGLPGFERSPEDIVLLQHSSGTTGLQKGVALSHQAVLNQLTAYAGAIRLSADDTIVSWLPLYHDMGLIAGFIMPVLNRVPLVLMSPFDWVRAPYKLMQAVSEYRGTLAWLPNFAYNFCAQKIRERDLEGVDLSTWRLVINCSEPTRWESHQLFFKRFQPYGLRYEALVTCYAMAENVFAVTQSGLDAPVSVDEIDARTFITQRIAAPSTAAEDTLKMLSAGPAIPNTRLCVLAEHPAENGEKQAARQQLPDRQVGEIALRSDCMLTGYYQRKDVTRQAFYEGWFLTGDLGYMVGEEVYVVGRKKDLIIVGGKNIYPQDLETLANQVPGVHQGRVVAFGVYSPEMGTEEVVIVAEVDEEDPGERQRIEDAIRQRITRGSDVTLRYVQTVGPKWIIKTSSGKTARLANRDKYLAEFRAQNDEG
jgi:fatty-acyl-CoA synthase